MPVCSISNEIPNSRVLSAQNSARELKPLWKAENIKASYFAGSGEGSGSSRTVVGHHKELGIYHILASIQKAELPDTCTARIFFSQQ
jgi:hypothetical protein